MHLFYRQGQQYIIDLDEPKEVEERQLTTRSIAQVYNIYNKIILAQSSMEILFFQEQEVTENEQLVLRWK